eukprot:1075061-Pleurochrysis_carterae.AAC.3
MNSHTHGFVRLKFNACVRPLRWPDETKEEDLVPQLAPLSLDELIAAPLPSGGTQLWSRGKLASKMQRLSRGTRGKSAAQIEHPLQG